MRVLTGSLKHFYFYILHLYNIVIPIINSVTPVNLKKAGMASRNIDVKTTIHVVLISFAVVFGLLVLGSYLLSVFLNDL